MVYTLRITIQHEQNLTLVSLAFTFSDIANQLPREMQKTGKQSVYIGIAIMNWFSDTKEGSMLHTRVTYFKKGNHLGAFRVISFVK